MHPTVVYISCYEREKGSHLKQLGSRGASLAAALHENSVSRYPQLRDGWKREKPAERRKKRGAETKAAALPLGRTVAPLSLH